MGAALRAVSVLNRPLALPLTSPFSPGRRAQKEIALWFPEGVQQVKLIRLLSAFFDFADYARCALPRLVLSCSVSLSCRPQYSKGINSWMCVLSVQACPALN